jgi:hypothetical protein
MKGRIFYGKPAHQRQRDHEISRVLRAARTRRGSRARGSWGSLRGGEGAQAACRDERPEQVHRECLAFGVPGWMALCHLRGGRQAPSRCRNLAESRRFGPPKDWSCGGMNSSALCLRARSQPRRTARSNQKSAIRLSGSSSASRGGVGRLASGSGPCAADDTRSHASSRRAVARSISSF